MYHQNQLHSARAGPSSDDLSTRGHFLIALPSHMHSSGIGLPHCLGTQTWVSAWVFGWTGLGFFFLLQPSVFPTQLKLTTYTSNLPAHVGGWTKLTMLRKRRESLETKAFRDRKLPCFLVQLTTEISSSTSPSPRGLSLSSVVVFLILFLLKKILNDSLNFVFFKVIHAPS